MAYSSRFILFIVAAMGASSVFLKSSFEMPVSMFLLFFFDMCLQIVEFSNRWFYFRTFQQCVLTIVLYILNLFLADISFDVQVFFSDVNIVSYFSSGLVGYRLVVFLTDGDV